MDAQNSTNHQHKNLSNHTTVDNNVLSDFYVACFEGNIDSVRKILEKNYFKNINRRETNCSTALHIAVECGHVDIARLLLHEYGVVRHLTDRNSQTAFALAQTEEIDDYFNDQHQTEIDSVEMRS
jgi:ankyrin repeat protein